MKKRLLALLLAGVMVFSQTGMALAAENPSAAEERLLQRTAITGLQRSPSAVMLQKEN